MSRSDYIISMIMSFVQKDYEGFMQECKELITFEESKGNYSLAARMKKALESDPKPLTSSLPQSALAITPLESKRAQKKAHNFIDDKGLLQIDEPQHSLEQVILPKAARNILNNLVEQWRFKDKLKQYNLSPQNRVLLYGTPGTGKTYSAYAIAKELGLKVAYVRFDSLVSSYLGQTGANLKEVFDIASSKPCLLLIDELDAIGKKRDDTQELGELKRIVISLLQNLDKLPENVLLVACTNHKHLLDQALWRRFDCIIPFQLPSELDRSKIIVNALRSRNVTLGENWIDLLSKVSEGLSGSDLNLVINNGIRNWIISKDDRRLQYYFIEEAVNNVGGEKIEDNLRIRLAKLLRNEQPQSFSLSYLSQLLMVPKSTLHKKLKEQEGLENE